MQSSKTVQKARVIARASSKDRLCTGSQWLATPPSFRAPRTSAKYSCEYRFTTPAFLGGGGSAVITS